ncbi:heparan-alpha-glucosaminide N-acetyltransferase domain-containing protein [Psychroserpens ponticola]|uniref:Heparan-alpha-glucosaminide N-acetyltransferase domain-containing protein n=1 Tax=Psychroserpens ponticola TaxID=2932268 RepID=A0ABY7S1V6_9FLAO|nr:heparan-alpha-glucosaminide N-acetyltransferase domain-containing protein [Psychroserpens ponticola]WCO03370.1 heparan-alpha-glucosaminide N-acetyltransferase domain-containing protein [Psychroserpens ponticola]
MISNRLFFIDAVRAFAILMMLQGHFIDTLLNPIYRNTSNLAFQIWSYFRGITAPTFFTISGLVFLFLLLRAKEKGDDYPRIKKGLYRSLLLIIIGYGLRINIFSWLNGELSNTLLIIDVLQCIGLSLIILIGCYVLLRKYVRLLSVLLLVLGCLCFLTEPLYRSLNLSHIPDVFANYMTKKNGSIFTILPWFGFTAFGGFLATVFFSHAHKNRFRLITIFSFFIFGSLLIEYSSWFLMKLYYWTDVELFKASAYYNYLFTRFGNVLLLFGIFYASEPLLKGSIIGKIGQKTLSIYVIHFIIIFGSFTGMGLKHFFSKSLTPIEVLFGAIIFMVLVCIISFHYVKTNAFIYSKLRQVFQRLR